MIVAVKYSDCCKLRGGCDAVKTFWVSLHVFSLPITARYHLIVLSWWATYDRDFYRIHLIVTKQISRTNVLA